MRIRGIETFLELRQPNELAQHGLGHEGGWHGKHEVLHQHAWAWAPAQAQYPCHGQAQGNHLHHKLGPGAPTQAQIQCHEQAQNTHSPHKLIPTPPRLGITLGRSFLLPAGRKAGRLSKWEVTGLARSLA